MFDKVKGNLKTYDTSATNTGNVAGLDLVQDQTF